jgi:hypothetical protein
MRRLRRTRYALAGSVHVCRSIWIDLIDVMTIRETNCSFITLPIK